MRLIPDWVSSSEGFMLSVEQGCLSSKVDSLPWSVRADLQNQSALIKNITEYLGKTNKPAFERKWGREGRWRQRQTKENKPIHTMFPQK